MKLFATLALTMASVWATNLSSSEVLDSISGRITNGEDAQTGEAPYIVSIKKNGHYCAGSIIEKNWVLTAAHCLVLGCNFKVVAGLNKVKDETGAQIRHIRNGKHCIAHEKYRIGVGPYDIGLIYIEKPFDLNKQVAAIHPASSKQTGPGIVFGWGKMSFGILPNKLQKLHTTIIDYKTCKAKFPLNAQLKLHETNICTHNRGSTAGACSGDSGGPLVRKTGIFNTELAGIVSWGAAPCTTSTNPTVYTDVSAFKDWIKAKTKEFRLAENEDSI